MPMTIADPVQAVLDRLGGVKQTGKNQWQAQCPVHDDKHASLSITRGDEGKAAIFCHAGCSTKDICAAIGLELRDLFPPKGNGKPATKSRGRIVKTYDYADAEGNLLYQVVRFDPKDFRQRRPNGNGDWIWKLGDTPRVLYHLAELIATNGDGWIFVCEGEKDADALAALGLTATTNPGGAGKWSKIDDSPLHGRRVAILPDRDAPGRKHAAQVARALHGKASEIKVIDLPGKGKDATDFIEAIDCPAEDARADLLAIADAAPVYEPTTEPETAADVQPSPPDELFRLTDYGNAQRLVAKHGTDLRYCHTWRAWLIWDGCRWARDETGEVRRRMKDTIRAINHEVASETDDNARKRLRKFAAKSESESAMRAAISLAESEPEIAITASVLDVDGWLLNCPNGTIDLHTGKLRPHRQGDLITKLAPVQFDPAAKCPRWDSFLHRIINGSEDLIGYLQRIAGLCLTADIREQILFIFYGQGANGKSVFLDTLTGLMGDYASEAPPDLLMVKRGSEHPTEIVDLCGKRLVIAGETEEGRRLRIQLVKRLTGNARLKGRFMRQDFFEFARTHKLILATNNRPVIQESTHAIWRRLRLIPFDVIIPDTEQDRTLTDKLKAEWPGILAWTARGCLDWQRDGLQTPNEVETATQTYETESDPLTEFFEACCILGKEFFVSRAEVFIAYENWADYAKERHSLGRAALYKRLREQAGITEGDKRINGKSARIFCGIGLLG